MGGTDEMSDMHNPLDLTEYFKTMRAEGKSDGNPDIVVDYIVTTEMRRMEAVGEENYEIFEDEHWPGATERELSLARERVEELL
jgi:hypothetical protein